MSGPARLIPLLFVGFLISFAPLGSAEIVNPDESTPTTLYFHIWDTFNKFVINTQAYNASFFDSGGVNFPTINEQGWDFNTIYGYSTAGPVEYDFNENGRPRLHPERGIAQDVAIDPNVQPVAYMYIDVRDLGGAEGTPGVLPQMTFRVTMRQGDDPGSDFNQGAEIMSGELTAWLFDGKFCPSQAANGNSQVLLPCVGATVDPYEVTGGYDSYPTEGPDGYPILYPSPEGIIEVVVPLDVGTPKIPKSEAFNVRVDWFQTANDAREDDTFSQGTLRIVMDESHQSRIEMAIMNPIYIEYIHPQVAAGTLLIHTGVNSPWGTYDVDAANITLRVDGPSEPQFLQQVIAQNQHVHGLHDQAAEITYLWKFRDEGAANGDYTITMEVPNVAGNAVATGTAGFTIEGKKAFGVDTEGEIVEPAGDESNDSPGVGAVTLVMAMLGVALLGRRWRA